MIKKNNSLLNHVYKFFVYTVIIVTTFFSSSCVSPRNLEYLQDKNKGVVALNDAQIEEYKLKPSDELYIQISSLDDAISNIFSGTNTQQSMYMGAMQPYGASLISYTIDKDGNLHLPVIGVISVKDKTLKQVSTMITESLKNILSQPVVSVKLVNRYVSVVGEVRNPGHFPYAQDKLTIYDAIALAGDITDFGNRNSVVLTRNENGKNLRITIDLTESDILSSNYYYLRPNDLVYVKPLKKKFWGLQQFPYSIVLNAMTTAILLYSVIK